MATYSSRFSLPCEWDRRPPGRHGAAVAQYLKVEGLTVKVGSVLFDENGGTRPCCWAALWHNNHTRAHMRKTQSNTPSTTQTKNKQQYVGPGRDDSQAAAVRADNPVPPDVPLYYFEALVVARGAQGYIGIGFAAEDVKADRLPGCVVF
jgi:hypothetical protein